MQHKMLPPVLSCWLAMLTGWWRPMPCLVRPATPLMISHTAWIQGQRHAHPSLELVPVVVLPLYHDSCMAVCLQPWPTAADLQVGRLGGQCCPATTAGRPAGSARQPRGRWKGGGSSMASAGSGPDFSGRFVFDLDFHLVFSSSQASQTLGHSLGV
jgi:hypothetical protein